jgi:hypothetical protein
MTLLLYWYYTRGLTKEKELLYQQLFCSLFYLTYFTGEGSVARELYIVSGIKHSLQKPYSDLNIPQLSHINL